MGMSSSRGRFFTIENTLTFHHYIRAGLAPAPALGDCSLDLFQMALPWLWTGMRVDLDVQRFRTEACRDGLLWPGNHGSVADSCGIRCWCGPNAKTWVTELESTGELNLEPGGTARGGRIQVAGSAGLLT